MINLSNGLSFEEYLHKTDGEQRKKQVEAYEKTLLSESVANDVKKVDERVNVVVFSEGFCPDCIVTLPFVKRIEELNSNIKVTIMPRSGNEELLREFTGEARIPTVMSFTGEMEPKGVYIELPQELKEMMIGIGEDERKKLIQDYRDGKYNSLIENELIKIIK